MTSNSANRMRPAIEDPEASFAAPRDVVASELLTREQKIAVLERWKFNVCSRIDAVSEGMNGHPSGAYARDVSLQRLIEMALGDLKASDQGKKHEQVEEWR